MMASLQENGEHPLVSAAAAGRIDTLKKLLDQGVSADIQTYSGLTALTAAATNGHLMCVKKLLEAGATVEFAGGHSGSTALLSAARGGHRACCEMLLEAGANPKHEDAYGESAQTAAHRYETEAKLQSSDFEQWDRLVRSRAGCIETEPPPPRPLYPERPGPDLESWYRSTDPTKMLWRPGAWMHQKRPAVGPVVQQERPRAFSSTGYMVPPVVVGVEQFTIGPPGYQSRMGRTVLPAEKFASQVEIKALRGSEGTLLAARLAAERTSLNPQVFQDDVPTTQLSMRRGICDAASSLRSVEAQESHLAKKFPSAPVRVGNAAVYASGLQRAAMSTPSAAASIYPMVEPPATYLASSVYALEHMVWKPSDDSLSALLEKAGMAAPTQEEDTASK